MLIGVDHDREALQTVIDAYDTTLLVDPGQEHLISRVEEFLPALFNNWNALGACGSAMLYPVDVDGVRPRTESQASAIERELCKRKDPVLHQLARVDYPDFYTLAAPGDHITLAADALGRQAPVVDIRGANESTIRVGGFVFDEVTATLDDRLAAMQDTRSPRREEPGSDDRRPGGRAPGRKEMVAGDGHQHQSPDQASVRVRELTASDEG